jgi:hypothetical protein
MRRGHSWVPLSHDVHPVDTGPLMTLREAYRVLDVSPSATWAAVKRAYRDLASRWHPDRFGPGTAAYSAAEERFKRINQAYERLGTAKKQRQQRATPCPVSTPSQASDARRAVQAQLIRSPADPPQRSTTQSNTSTGKARPNAVSPFDELPAGWGQVLSVAGAVGCFCLGILWSSSLGAMLVWTAFWTVLAAGAFSLSTRVQP